MSDAGRIIDALEDHFGIPARMEPKDPLSELIFTILSQNTSDTNRDRSYGNLRRRFGRWEDVMRADVSEVEREIRVGGLGPQKSRRIKAILEEIHAERGTLSLDYLGDLSADDARRELLSFPGVGEKTAAIVLLFSLNKPSFPVDTHVLRVTKRLSLIPPKTDASKAHAILGDLIPPEKYYPTHINLIRLGRTLCRPRNPRCADCPLLVLCPFGKEFLNR